MAGPHRCVHPSRSVEAGADRVGQVQEYDQSEERDDDKDPDEDDPPLRATVVFGASP